LRLGVRDVLPVAVPGPVLHDQAEALTPRHHVRAKGIARVGQAGDAAFIVGHTKISLLKRACRRGDVSEQQGECDETFQAGLEGG